MIPAFTYTRIYCSAYKYSLSSESLELDDDDEEEDDESLLWNDFCLDKVLLCIPLDVALTSFFTVSVLSVVSEEDGGLCFSFGLLSVGDPVIGVIRRSVEKVNGYKIYHCSIRDWCT